MLHAEAFADLWPTERRKEVLKILAGISFHRGGDELSNKNAVSSICVFDNAPVSEVLRHLGMGFSHVLQRERDDFAFSLLSTALIKKKPKAFFANPFPFLFRSFEDGLSEVKPVTASIQWNRPWNKHEVIEQILEHLSKTRAKLYKDVVAANMDELLTNACPENEESTAPVSVTMAFAADRLCCAVRDNQREFNLKKVRERLWDLSMKKKWTPNQDETGGAGLGLGLMVSNSTAYYLCHNRGIGTTATFLIDVRKGLRDLETLPKNAHIFEG